MKITATIQRKDGSEATQVTGTAKSKEDFEKLVFTQYKIEGLNHEDWEIVYG